MSDWFENGGALAALGGMAHLKNQSAQRNDLEKQRELLHEQLASAKAVEISEKERLEIEKKRFEIQEENRRLNLEKAQAVKSIRKTLADASSAFERIDKILTD